MENDFESRRRERRRREKLRKKRIRAAIVLIALIGVIILIVVGISMCNKKNTANAPTNGNNIQTTQQPVSVAPTLAPSPNTFKTIPAASEQNDLLEIIRKSGETKHCYLTFDDGPTTNITPQILDTLRRYNVKATFFQIGSLIKANPDMARRVFEEGHLIANHSNGHNYEKLYVSAETFMNEVNECYEAIKDVTGEAEPFKLVRFPGGGYNSSADSYSPVKQQCKTAMKENGFYYCDWNALNGDAEGKTKNAQELLDYMIRNLDGEENVVVLMHDASAKQATADALGSIIEYFMKEGYTFHRLDDVDYNASAAASSSTSSTSASSSSTSTSTSTSASSGSSSSTSKPSSSGTPASKAPSSSPTSAPSATGSTSGSQSSSSSSSSSSSAATQAPQNNNSSSSQSTTGTPNQTGGFVI